jgi:hypothetical protein
LLAGNSGIDLITQFDAEASPASLQGSQRFQISQTTFKSKPGIWTGSSTRVWPLHFAVADSGLPTGEAAWSARPPHASVAIYRSDRWSADD